MQIVMVGGVGKKSAARIGNTCGLARIYDGRKLIGLCLDTPNSIASAMKHSGATRAVDMFGDRVEIDATTLAAGGWMKVEQSGWSAL